MSSVSQDGELNVSKYLDGQQKDILNHALKASSWASGFDEFPTELSRLIKQHHGSVSGYGFVKVLSPQITVMSLLYILMESISLKILLSSGGKLNIKKVIDEVKNEFVSTKFHNLADEFVKFLKEELQKKD
jgi:hypothetical protein